jgi:hypothetical protein
MKLLLAALTALGISLSSLPSQALGNVVGEGATTCEHYASRPLDKKNKYIIWTQGYITAFNNLSGKTPNVVGSHDYNWVRLWLDEYCGKNAGKYFVEAVVALTDTLSAGGH